MKNEVGTESALEFIFVLHPSSFILANGHSSRTLARTRYAAVPASNTANANISGCRAAVASTCSQLVFSGKVLKVDQDCCAAVPST